jgi:WD40 repeat protein
MEDGSIYLLKDNNSQIKLLGHESRVSKLKLNSNRLYSSGYDGKVNFWYINNEKIEPMELISKQCWILDFTVSADQQHIWIGDKNGNITEALLDAKKMKDIIETELRKANRDLTEEEWNYYIGKDTPYAPVVLGNRKEVRK